jgi:hypothetical protein
MRGVTGSFSVLLSRVVTKLFLVPQRGRKHRLGEFFDLRARPHKTARTQFQGFRAASKRRAEGVLVLAGSGFNYQRTKLQTSSARNRLPALYKGQKSMHAGGLMFLRRKHYRNVSASPVHVDTI